MVVFRYIREIITVITAIVIIALSITISCQREEIIHLKGESVQLSEEIERIRHEMENERKRFAAVQEFRRRDEEQVVSMFEDIAQASTEHHERMQAISEAESEDPAVPDWLDCAVPDSVRSLFECTSGPGRVCADQPAGSNAYSLSVP